MMHSMNTEPQERSTADTAWLTWKINCKKNGQRRVNKKVNTFVPHWKENKCLTALAHINIKSKVHLSHIAKKMKAHTPLLL